MHELVQEETLQEPPELLEPLELLNPPELLPLVMQSEPMHDCPLVHMLHALPANPQALSSEVPGWHAPVVSQQPEHVVAHEAPLSSPLLLPLEPESSPELLESSPLLDDDEELASSPLLLVLLLLPEDELP